MKTLKSIALILFLLIQVNASSQAQIKVKKAKQKFGFVKQGKIVTLEYEFINTGDKPLKITDYKAECSCTEVEIPSPEIIPKQKGIIKVTFNTKDAYDRPDRIVEIISNATVSPVYLRFKGVVLKK